MAISAIRKKWTKVKAASASAKSHCAQTKAQMVQMMNKDISQIPVVWMNPRSPL
jgi:hypothetical protein